MALSASESQLLTETCRNMNQAAHSCRDVLEMLRSLGSSGVVDIAAHNNDTNAHSNIDSLAKINTSTNKFAVGKAGDTCSGIFNGEPFRACPTGTGSGKDTGINSLLLMCETRDYSDLFPQLSFYFAETDSNGALANGKNVPVGVWRNYYKYLDSGNTAKTVLAAIRAEHDTTRKNTQFTFHIKLGSDETSATSSSAYIMDDERLGPNIASVFDLGTSYKPFKDAYFVNAATVTSDRRSKENIASLDAKAVAFIKRLRPVQYTMANRLTRIVSCDEDGNAVETMQTPGVRSHWGLIAQEVKEALASAGYEDAAVWCLSDKEDPASQQALRYEELIAPLIKAVQVLASKVEALEAR